MALSAEWNPLGESYYRKYEIYSMEWESKNVDLQKYIIAAAPYAGPIALMRDDSKAKDRPQSKPLIILCTSAGRELAVITWNSGQVVKMGWSCTEDLLCVQDDGSVLVYDIFGKFKRPFGMGQEAKDNKVIDCQIFNSYNGTGIAVMTSTYRIFVVNNVDDPRIRRLAEIPSADIAPSCWSIVNQDRQSRALVAKNADLYLLDHGGQCEKQYPKISGVIDEYVEIAVSFNNKYLALFTNTGLLWIGSSDLLTVFCEFDTKSPVKPQQLVWCGTGSIVGYWENILLMVGPKKDWVKYTYETPVYLVPEVDGLRIVGNSSHEFLQRVPDVIEDIFKIGSMAPGSVLFEASREFQKGSQRADEYIRMIKDKLDKAVEQCIEAAGHEYEPTSQKALLRAASFGKCFLTDYRPEGFYNMCQMLRVLNAVREHNIGIPLTYTQLHNLHLSVLLDRLVLRRQYCLAIRICQYLKMPDSEGASRILAHWACYKVQQKEIRDEQLARDIADKLGDTPGVSYSEIANRAFESSRTELAIRLLDFEPKASEQVPLLMKMKRDQLALAKAIESGDTDLVHTVLLQLENDMPRGEFFMAIRTMPVAHKLYLQYCREQNPKTLQGLYYQDDNHEEYANCKVSESYLEDTLDKRLAVLATTQDSYNKAKLEWSAKQTEEQTKLMKYQRRLEEEYTTRFYMDMSLHETIYKLITENNHKVAEQLRKEFKVPDRRYWWLRVQALSECGDWMELEKFSKSKKSPIGYEPFVEMCMKYKNKVEAQKYLSKVSPENRFKCYVKIGELEQAADVAFQQKNEDDLNYLLPKCGANKQLAEKIVLMKNQLGGRR